MVFELLTAAGNRIVSRLRCDVMHLCIHILNFRINFLPEFYNLKFEISKFIRNTDAHLQIYMMSYSSRAHNMPFPPCFGLLVPLRCIFRHLSKLNFYETYKWGLQIKRINT